MKKLKLTDKNLQWLLIALVFVLTLAWSFATDLSGGPDEGARYLISKYIYTHHALPTGDLKEVRNDLWGVSYAYSPIISYMVSAVFMWIVGLFDASKEALIHAARLADVLFITMAAWFVLETGKRLFHDGRRWLFSIMVVFLPGFQFLGTYVNTDSLALLAAAIILYAWARYMEEGWTWKNCIILAVGLGICFLSYYNAYGWILFSFLFFCITVLFCTDQPWKERWKFLFSRGFSIAGITFLLAGWWFIRNAVLYDGDFLGRKSGNALAEKYAAEPYKPSIRATPQRMGWSFKQFLLYQNPGWNHNWLIMVLISFVGTFGMFDIYMNETVSKLYLLYLFVGGLGILGMLKAFDWRKREISVVREKDSVKKTKKRCVSVYRKWEKQGVFNLAMLGTMLTPVILLVSYAYSNDLQAQGRYIMPGVYPIMYFVACGYGKLLGRFVKKESVREWFYRISCIVWVLAAVLNYFCIILPAYRVA